VRVYGPGVVGELGAKVDLGEFLGAHVRELVDTVHFFSLRVAFIDQREDAAEAFEAGNIFRRSIAAVVCLPEVFEQR
jgi:hypothetical protein